MALEASAPVKHQATFEELNKPLDFIVNQDHVAKKITEFRDSLIERFGSSKVPTPAIRDVYR